MTSAGKITEELVALDVVAGLVVGGDEVVEELEQATLPSTINNNAVASKYSTEIDSVTFASRFKCDSNFLRISKIILK